MYIIFENNGVLDLRALTVMGINAKPTHDNPIGFFGTGLKLSAAVITRLGGQLEVQTGEHGDGSRYLVTKRATSFRDKEFDQLHLSFYNDGTGDMEQDRELSYTTEYGKTWHPWMALRELETNVLDEGGTSYLSSRVPAPELGKVRFVVHLDNEDALLKGYTQFDNIFFSRLQKKLGVKAWQERIADFIPATETKYLYYRGVCVLQLNGKQFANTYNLNSAIDLTEDRTAKYQWEVEGKVIDAVVSCSDEKVIRTALGKTDPSEWLEASMSFPYYDRSQADIYPEYRVYIDVINTMLENKRPINDHAYSVYVKRREAARAMSPADLTGAQQFIVERAVQFAARLGLNTEYDIVFTYDMPENTFGRARDGVAYINMSTFSYGEQTVIATIIEELAHLDKGFKDETREFQDWLLRSLIVSMIEADYYARKAV